MIVEVDRFVSFMGVRNLYIEKTIADPCRYHTSPMILYIRTGLMLKNVTDTFLIQIQINHHVIQNLLSCKYGFQ